LRHPALRVAGVDADFVLAVADDFCPTAAESQDDCITLFFREPRVRDAARVAISQAFPSAAVDDREVDDEDWARRSQQSLQPITVGRLTIYPSPEPSALSPLSALSRSSIVIVPSMGFGTGHHATTRLCLRALHTEDLAGLSVLDIGTGSGVLAIAAARLGAATAIGIDNDPDAIQAALDNLALNQHVANVRFEQADLTEVQATVDIVVANLTGALLAREAHRLLEAVRPGGRLIVSGLLDTERDAVIQAFGTAALEWQAHEDEWVALSFRANVPARSPV
jgi:ribosomal protein L11 methyltransferase